MQTNATNSTAATILADLNAIDQGTLFSANIQKMGQIRGPKNDKVLYGDDRVQVILWAGFSYMALIERSFKMLNHQVQRGGYIESLAKSTLEVHEDCTIEDVCGALQETRSWFRRVLSRQEHAGTSSAPMGIWEPLTVGGVQVQGARVYRGKANKNDPRAPVPGAVYISGVKLGEVIVTPAANGQWTPDSKPKTIAKQLLKESLPVGLYCQYRLDPDRVANMLVGRKAAKAAKTEGVWIDPDALRQLFKIAP